MGDTGLLSQFWEDGGMRVCAPVSRALGPGAVLSLLLQPDGDVVVSVPPGFGDDPSDLEDVRQLLRLCRSRLRRISRAVNAVVRPWLAGFAAAGTIASWAAPALAVLHHAGPAATVASLAAAAAITAGRAPAVRWLAARLARPAHSGSSRPRHAKP